MTNLSGSYVVVSRLCHCYSECNSSTQNPAISYDSQTINTTKPLHFQFYNLQFQSFPLQCTICRSYCTAAQPATNSDVAIFKVLLSKA